LENLAKKKKRESWSKKPIADEVGMGGGEVRGVR